jgi:LysR family transcriptional regulator, hca operon transcriptional activator
MPAKYGYAGRMELRHLRYFIAVAEEGSLTLAAERRLFTAQPSLSRQIRDLEYELGVELLVRSARGVTLTEAGRVFLDQARLVLAQLDAATAAARHAGRPSKPGFALGFLTGQEMDWLSPVMALLKDQLPNIDVTVSSHYSPQLAEALVARRLDLAIMRREAGRPELVYRTIRAEKLLVVLPSDHTLTAQSHIPPQALAAEPFIAVSATAPSLRRVVDDYLQYCGVQPRIAHEVDNLAMAMSLVASTRGVALLPAYAKNFMPWSVTSRPLAGEVPSIDLVAGWHQGNTSPVLASLLPRLEEL